MIISIDVKQAFLIRRFNRLLLKPMDFTAALNVLNVYPQTDILLPFHK